MQEKQTKTEKVEILKKTVQETKPNENMGYYFSSSLKITDPDTGEVLVKMRCD